MDFQHFIDNLPAYLGGLLVLLGTVSKILGTISPLIYFIAEKRGMDKKQVERNLTKISQTIPEVEKIVRQLAATSKSLTDKHSATVAENTPATSAMAKSILTAALDLHAKGANPTDAARQATVEAFINPKNQKAILKKLKSSGI